MPKQRSSYAWALQFKQNDPELARLTPTAQEGIQYARELAEDARERSLLALQREPLPKPLSVARIAAEDRTSPIAIHTAIKQAKLELFGERSERAIYYALRRRERHADLAKRRCSGPACRQLLPLRATVRRRYCSDRCRVNGFRARRAIVPEPQFRPAGLPSDSTRAMSEEIQLGGGATTDGVVRVGDTVRRPRRYASQLMRDVLVHLERAGFDAAPRWLGLDDQGRDVLTWVEGETLTERGQMHPYIGDPPGRITFTDEQVAAVMRLLRRYHDTFGDDLICHGDFGPWNIVWRTGLPFAVIDFDNACRGDAADDVAYALRMFISYGFAEAMPTELARRTEVALQAYGAAFDVPAILTREHDLAEERCRQNGWHRQLAKLPTERAWLAANRGLL